MGCGFFGYSWKLLAYNGAFLLTIDNFSFFTCNWSFLLKALVFYLQFELFAYSGIVHLIRALTWWEFRPQIKIFSLPPSPNIPARHPPGPSPPPLLGAPPPSTLQGFSIRTENPPFLAPRNPPSPFPSRKTNIRNIHQVKGLYAKEA